MLGDTPEAKTSVTREADLLLKLEKQVKLLKLTTIIMGVVLVLAVVSGGMYGYNLEQQSDLKYKKLAKGIVWVEKNLKNETDDLDSKTDDIEDRLTNIENYVSDIDGRLINLNI